MRIIGGMAIPITLLYDENGYQEESIFLPTTRDEEPLHLSAPFSSLFMKHLILAGP